MQTISSTTFVGTALIERIKQAYPMFDYVFSPSLVYPFPDVDDRANASENSVAATKLPLFVWNRSALRPSELGSRGVRFQAFANIPGISSDVMKYRTAHCEFDFNFMIVDKDIATIESFEIDFLSKEGLGRITQIDVDFSSANIGTLHYYVTWDYQLSAFDPNVDTNSFVSITGTARIHGWFISLYGEAPVITTINETLKTKYGSIETVKIG